MLQYVLVRRQESCLLYVEQVLVQCGARCRQVDRRVKGIRVEHIQCFMGLVGLRERGLGKAVNNTDSCKLYVRMTVHL